jgi:hypothetical protein
MRRAHPRRASGVGVVTVNWQQVCLGIAAAGRNIDIWVTDQVLQFYDGDILLRTEKPKVNSPTTLVCCFEPRIPMDRSRT